MKGQEREEVAGASPFAGGGWMLALGGGEQGDDEPSADLGGLFVVRSRCRRV